MMVTLADIHISANMNVAQNGAESFQFNVLFYCLNLQNAYPIRALMKYYIQYCSASVTYPGWSVSWD